jgi:hypothetical protein
MDYRGLMRRKLLEDIYDKMSDDEKRTFIQLTMQDKDHNEIMDALQRQQQQIGRVADKMESQTWLSSFGSDIAANFTSDGIIYLLSRLLRSFR